MSVKKDIEIFTKFIFVLGLASGILFTLLICGITIAFASENHPYYKLKKEVSHGEMMYFKGVRNGCQHVLLKEGYSKDTPMNIGNHCDKLFWDTAEAWKKSKGK